MKTVTISVEIKKSYNYHTFGCSETITIEDGDDLESIRRLSQARCRKAVQEQIDLEKLNAKK